MASPSDFNQSTPPFRHAEVPDHLRDSTIFRKPNGNLSTQFRTARYGPRQRQTLRPIYDKANARYDDKGRRIAVDKVPTLSTRTRTAFQAGDTLTRLQKLPYGPFGPAHQRTIAENVSVLNCMNADTLDEHAKAERESRGVLRKVHRALKLANPDYKASDSNYSDSEDEESDGGKGGDGNGKTPAGGTGDPDDSGDAGKENAALGGKKRGRSNSGAAEGQPDAKKAKTYPLPSVQVQEPVDIAKLAPIPIQIKYPSHPTTDRSDEWFSENFRRLFHQMSNVVTHYFAIHDIDQDDKHPWALKMTPEFIRWAEQVADPNFEPDGRGWDELLKDTVQRKWFLLGILMKIFKVKVFDEYLFGASREQKELAFAVDRAFLSREGFQRTLLRSSTTHTVLGANAVTESFYPSVAKLTARISLLLQPLVTYLYSLPPPPNTKLPLVQDLYQSLHNLVSQAAYLSLCVRCSPSIIQFVDLQPGSDWDPDDMHSLETEDYTKSKQAVIDRYSIYHYKFCKELKRFTKKAKALAPKNLKKDADGKRTEPEPESDAYKRALADEARKRDGKLPEPSRTHRALTKIAVWPVIRRYTPGSEEQDLDPTIPLREKDGFRIMLIAKGAVVAKYGRKERDEKSRVGLEDWVRVRQREFGEKGRGVERVKTAAKVVVGAAGLGAGMTACLFALKGDVGVDAVVRSAEEVFVFIYGLGMNLGLM